MRVSIISLIQHLACRRLWISGSGIGALRRAPHIVALAFAADAGRN